jgi:hypothetical protein
MGPRKPGQKVRLAAVGQLAEALLDDAHCKYRLSGFFYLKL